MINLPLTEKEAEFLKKSLNQSLDSHIQGEFTKDSPEYTTVENILNKLPNTGLVSTKEIGIKETILEY